MSIVGVAYDDVRYRYPTEVASLIEKLEEALHARGKGPPEEMVWLYTYTRHELGSMEEGLKALMALKAYEALLSDETLARYRSYLIQVTLELQTPLRAWIGRIEVPGVPPEVLDELRKIVGYERAHLRPWLRESKKLRKAMAEPKKPRKPRKPETEPRKPKSPGTKLGRPKKLPTPD